MTSDDYPYWTHEDLHDLEYYEWLADYKAMVEYVDSIDADYAWYPPVEYWDETLA